MNKKSILIMFGGKSYEHDISIVTGVMTMNSIDTSVYDVHGIYVSIEGKMYTSENLSDIGIYKQLDVKKLMCVTMLTGDKNIYRLKGNKLKKLFSVDLCINCMHGGEGENGSITGLIRCSNILVASPSVFAQSAFMDKSYTKLVLQGLNVNVMPYIKVTESAYLQNPNLAVRYIEKKLRYPLIIKPSRLGSSIGIYTAESSEQLSQSLIKAFDYDDKLIIEEKLTNAIEVNCACYKSGRKIIASECESINLQNDILSFEDKYLTEDLSKKQFPAKLEEKIINEIKQTTKYIYRKMQIIGVVRVDFFIKGKQVIVNEINTVPGSLSNYLFDEITFQSLLSDIIETGFNQKEKDVAFLYKSDDVLDIKSLKTH